MNDRLEDLIYILDRIAIALERQASLIAEQNTKLDTLIGNERIPERN